MARKASFDPVPLTQIAIIDEATIAQIVAQIPPQENDMSLFVRKVTGKSLFSDAHISDLTDEGETTLHTHPASVAITATAWGKYF